MCEFVISVYEKKLVVVVVAALASFQSEFRAAAAAAADSKVRSLLEQRTRNNTPHRIHYTRASAETLATG